MAGKLTAGTPVTPQARPPITREQLRAYADASGDFNAIHLDDAVAQKAGLPGVIAHGMLIAGMIADRAEGFASETGEKLKLASFQTRFKAMTLLGDEISVGGSIKEVTDADLCLELQAQKKSGEIVATAFARFARA